jgi:hypothetical protein
MSNHAESGAGAPAAGGFPGGGLPGGARRDAALARRRRGGLRRKRPRASRDASR